MNQLRMKLCAEFESAGRAAQSNIADSNFLSFSVGEYLISRFPSGHTTLEKGPTEIARFDCPNAEDLAQFALRHIRSFENPNAPRRPMRSME